jgi:ABC-type multidrug transport system fused ATPase/permease subunit
MSMTNKYRSVIGEKGVRLSGGQRQRLALARALLASGSLLILDESTSQLDSESERAIQGAIEKLRGKVTQVIIAHRLSTVLHADKIIVMDKGRMVASGTHHELLETSPIYRKLHDLQFQD